MRVLLGFLLGYYMRGKKHLLVARYDLQFEPGMIIAQTPQGGERVDCGTVIGVTVSGERLEWLR